MAVTGTLTALVLDGIRLNVFGDTDGTQAGGNFEVSELPTSGINVKKMVKMAGKVTGVSSYTTAVQHDLLSELNDRIKNFTIRFTDAEGNTYRGIGFINYQGRTQADSKSTLDLIPENSAGFALFAESPAVINI